MHRVWGRRMLNHFEEYFFFGGVGGAVLCSMQGLSFLTRDQPVPSALGARSLNHWTARDVQYVFLLIYFHTFSWIFIFAIVFIYNNLLDSIRLPLTPIM